MRTDGEEDGAQEGSEPAEHLFRRSPLNTSILPLTLQQYVILFRLTFIPLSIRSDVTRVLIATADVTSCMYVTVWYFDHNRAARCRRGLSGTKPLASQNR